MSALRTFFRRMEKAQAKGNGYHHDRVFPGTEDMDVFAEDLAEFVAGFHVIAAENEHLKRQIRDLNI